jgi:hypothetical protein
MMSAAQTVMGCPPATLPSGHLLLALSPPTVPLAALRPPVRYPPGAIAAFDPKIKRYRVAIRIGTVLSGIGASSVTHFEVQQPKTLPVGVPETTLFTFQKATGTLPLYKNPLFWTAIGVGAVAVGGGSYVLYRRRRRLTT